jgi:hypothetical protein
LRLRIDSAAIVDAVVVARCATRFAERSGYS